MMRGSNDASQHPTTSPQPWGDAVRIALKGAAMSDDQAKALESFLETHPRHVAARIALCGYSWTRRRVSSSAATLWVECAMWFAENSARSMLVEVLYPWLEVDESNEDCGPVLSAWLKQAASAGNDPDILMHAAWYLRRKDPTLSSNLLRKSLSLDPENPRRLRFMCRIYQDSYRRAGVSMRRQKAGEVLSVLESAVAQAQGVILREIFTLYLAEAAFDAGQIEKAEMYAKELIENTDEESGDAGNRLHRGHIILGRVALLHEDLETAERDLKAAVEAPMSPTLSSFGPDVQLAIELLQHGRRTSVIDYVEVSGSRFGPSVRKRMLTRLKEFIM